MAAKTDFRHEVMRADRRVFVCYGHEFETRDGAEVWRKLALETIRSREFQFKNPGVFEFLNEGHFQITEKLVMPEVSPTMNRHETHCP